MATTKISELPLAQKLGNTGAAPDSTRSWDFAYTWNSVATTFSANYLDITDTVSAAGSMLIDYRVGGVAKFQVRKDGLITTGGPTVSNGLTKTSGNIKLGGTLSENTTIDTNGRTFIWNGLVEFAYILADNDVSVLGTLSTTLAQATNDLAPTIASASTIAPTTPITFISGVAAIDTITVPSSFVTNGGSLTLIPTGIFTTTTVGGNIGLASIAVVGKALTMFYDSGTDKWYPSY